MNGVSNAFVDFTDFYPTLLDIAGVNPDPKPRLDGYSILPILQGEANPERKFIYGYYWTRGRDPLKVKEYVRDDKYKYYRSGELYNPEIDPEEKEMLDGPDYELIRTEYEKKLNQVRNLSTT